MDLYFREGEKLLSTTNHVYNERHVIGNGATSMVFRGIHKRTGEQRALKIPKYSNLKEISREVEALVALNHKHIVKFFGVENDAVGGQTVVVMEICDGGSLHTFLYEPENRKGLEDEEFLRLLFGLRSGLKYLQRKGFLHRDLKPGNILRSLGEDNFFIYKLSDFGSSRQIPENGNFQSLAGTEEYLHPEVYKKAFVDKKTPAMFNSSVDRWSLGATLAHACTGGIPFQPFHGVRGNRNIMYTMISQKPPGAIGGTQEEENGKIIWRSTIPDDATMSECLRCLIQPVLCGLMEKDPARQWNFPTFFQEIMKLKRKKTFHIFNSDTGDHLHVYLDPESHLPSLMDEVAKQTGCPPSNQSFYHNNQNLENNQTVKNYPDTNIDNPICLVTRSTEEPISIQKEHIEKPMALFSNHASIGEDVKVAVSQSFMAFRIHKLIGNSIRVQRITRQLPHMILACLSILMTTFQSKNEATNELLDERMRRLDLLKECEIRREKATNTVNISKSLSEQFMAAKNILLKLKRTVASVKRSMAEADRLLVAGKTTGDYFNECQECSADCERRCSKLFIDSKSILKQMRERKEQGEINFIEERIHDCDRRRLEEVSSTAASLWESHCEPNMINTVRAFTQWKRLYIQLVKTMGEVENGLYEINTLNRIFADHLIWISAYSGREWREFSSLMSDSWNRMWKIECPSNLVPCEMREGRELMSKLNGVANDVDSAISENSANTDRRKLFYEKTSPRHMKSPFIES